MEQHEQDPIKRLSAFIGNWSVEASLPDGPPMDLRGRQEFEFMPGGGFLVQRWEVPHPAPNPHGIALIGFDVDRSIYMQHYFDCRGIARVYQMSFADGVWKLWRDSADFSPLDFAQRFTGRFTEDGQTISGRWEKSLDGSGWQHDLDLSYRKLGDPRTAA
jgi:hypothetical protein